MTNPFPTLDPEPVPGQPHPSIPALRLAVGLGDPDRERRLQPVLDVSREVVVVERCLAADELLERVQRGRVDVVLLAFDLHRLTQATLSGLRQTRLPLVLLAPAHDEPRWRDAAEAVLPLEASPEVVRNTLVAVAHGERQQLADEEDDTVGETARRDDDETASTTIAVASGHGSPGRTTVAVNLAATLGAVAPTVLVDADLAGPSIAALLDATPTRNLYMLAHAEPQSPREWDHALAQETQPLGFGSDTHLLCGLPKPELRARLSPPFIQRLLAELERRYHYVILDVGADLLGAEVALHRLAVGHAHQTLLVTATDLAGLWHGRQALRLLTGPLELRPERVALVLNQHNARRHHRRAEIEWALQTPSAAVIPYDYPAAQRAQARQQPLVYMGRSRAGRALLDLADRIHGQRILLPPEVAPRRWWHVHPSFRWPRPPHTARSRRLEQDL